MKIYIPDILTKDDLQYFTELFLAIPYIDRPLYSIVSQHANWWNEGLFTQLFFNEPIHSNVSMSECEVICIPFKYSANDDRIINICNQAKKYNKQVVSFFNDDFTDCFNSLPENLILFRTSAYKTKLNRNERILPVLVSDHCNINNVEPQEEIKNNVGFCGHAEGIREGILNKIESVVGSQRCNFIIRSTFYHHTGQVNIKTRREYYKNITTNLFTLCIRGAGNFSYRFYEALSLGRIPILIDTDIALPFDRMIDWNDYIIKINENEIGKLTTLIDSCIIEPIKVRKLWETYFSPAGYTKNFLSDI